MNKTLSQGAPSCLATGSEGGRMQGQPRACVDTVGPHRSGGREEVL